MGRNAIPGIGFFAILMACSSSYKSLDSCLMSLFDKMYAGSYVDVYMFIPAGLFRAYASGGKM
jgi:hypothetical protein